MKKDDTDSVPLVPISEFCKTGSGGTPARSKASLYFGGHIPWVKSGELRENTITKTEETITEIGLKESAAKLLPRDTLLVALYGATVGRVGVLGVEAATNQAICHVIPNQEIADRKYLFYALQAQVPNWLSKRVGGGQPNISQGIVRDTLIPLPSLEDQKRIAYLLNKVERLIGGRKQHLQQLDDLLRSVFFEMFGDPVHNEKGWDKKTFSELLTKIESGKSPKCEARPANSDEWGVLKLGAVTSCVYKEGDNKALPADTPPHSAIEVKAGDVLFSRKNTYELVAATAYVFETRPKLLLPDLIFRLAIREDVELNPIYLWQLLISEPQRRVVQATASGAAGSMPNISKANLNRVQIPCPPASLQNKHAHIVSKVEDIKSLIKCCLRRLEELYAVLSKQAFKGELDLSRVVAPDVDPQDAAANEIPDATPISDADKPFELPTPTRPLLDDAPHSRKSAIEEWLAAYSHHHDNEPFSADDFLGLIQQKLSAMESELDADWVSREVDAADYDQVKEWVFQSLDGGQLGQSYDDDENQVRVSAAKD